MADLLLVQITIHGENSDLGHIFQDVGLESVITKCLIHTGAVTDNYTFTSKH